jgi:hypothetical protein
VKKQVRGILAIAIMLAVVTPVFAEPTVYHYAWTVDIHGSFWSVCAGEDVVYEGTGRYELHGLTDSAGGYHWTYHGHHNLIGVGQVTGEVYQVISTEVQHQHTKGFQSEWTFVNTSPSISHGGLVNGMFTIRNHVTVNANGDVTVSYGELEITCRG